MKRLCLLLCVVMCVATACAKSDGNSIQLIVAGAPDKTADADTAKIEMTIKVVAAETESIVISGAMDFTHDLTSLNFVVEGETLEGLVDSKAVYYKFPDLDLPEGKSWLRVTFADVKKLGGGDLGAMRASGQDDPSSSLNQLRGANDVTKVGVETVRGARTTHYRAVVDLEEAAKKSSKEDAKALRALVDDVGVTTQPIDVWLDNGERVRRISADVDLRHADLSDEEKDLKSVTTTMEFYDFGTPLTVQVPPAKDVANFEDAFAEGSGTATPATTALKDRMLTTTLPGYGRQPDGFGDAGPVDIEKAVRDDGAKDARGVLTSLGFVGGYSRLWAKEGHTLVDSVYQFGSADGATAYGRRAIASGPKVGAGLTVTEFTPTGMSSAKGFVIADGDDSAVILLFTRGAYTGQIFMNGGDASAANATKVAKAQYNKLG